MSNAVCKNTQVRSEGAHDYMWTPMGLPPLVASVAGRVIDSMGEIDYLALLIRQCVHSPPMLRSAWWNLMPSVESMSGGESMIFIVRHGGGGTLVMMAMLMVELLLLTLICIMFASNR